MIDKTLVIKCIDIGNWKHSWHNKLQSKNDLIKASEVINRLIDERSNEIILLKKGRRELYGEVMSYDEEYQDDK